MLSFSSRLYVHVLRSPTMREQQSDLGADDPLRNTRRALERVVRAELETYILPADLHHFADVDPDWQSKRLARGGRPVVSNGGSVCMYQPLSKL